MNQEANRSYIEYMIEFGDRILHLEQLKTAYGEAQNRLQYCQNRTDAHQPIRQNEMDEAVDVVMADARRHLDDLQERLEYCQKMPLTSKKHDAFVKETYAAYARRIHPEIHPELYPDEALNDAWKHLQACYLDNNFQGMEEVKEHLDPMLAEKPEPDHLQVDKLKSKMHGVHMEIQLIKNHKPYQYKYILASEKDIDEKKQALDQEIAAYEKAIRRLERLMRIFPIDRTVS